MGTKTILECRQKVRQLFKNLNKENYDPDLKILLENRYRKGQEEVLYFRSDDGSLILDKHGKRMCISKNVKPEYHCPICQKDLTTLGLDSLRQHYRNNHRDHPIAKPLTEKWESLRFQCSTCNFQNADRYNVIVHMYLKHPDIPILGSVPIQQKPKINAVVKPLSFAQEWKLRYILSADKKVIERNQDQLGT